MSFSGGGAGELVETCVRFGEQVSDSGKFMIFQQMRYRRLGRPSLPMEGSLIFNF